MTHTVPTTAAATGAPPAGGRPVAGPALVVIGTGHLVLGAVLHRAVLGRMLRGGWIGSADDRPRPGGETVARQRAFWFQVSGVALVLLGRAVGGRERGGPPDGLGWSLGALAVLGGAAVPRSGFWLLLAPAAALVTGSRRAGRRDGT